MPLYGGDGRFTRGVFKLDADRSIGERGDLTGEWAVMFSMESGDGLGLLPDLCLTVALRDLDDPDEVDGDDWHDDSPARLCSSGEDGGEDLKS
jgi:hypothetical protein